MRALLRFVPCGSAGRFRGDASFHGQATLFGSAPYVIGSAHWSASDHLNRVRCEPQRRSGLERPYTSEERDDDLRDYVG
jgi:hypothetical protein